VQDLRVETSRSTPNFAATSNGIANLSVPIEYPPRALERSSSYFTANTAPTSLKARSHSSSASDAVQDDLPSPLEHISQQAAAYRSRVASTPRTAPRARFTEVMARIDLIQHRRASSSAAGQVEYSPVSRYTVPPTSPPVARYTVPPTSPPVSRYAVDSMSPTSSLGSASRHFSTSNPVMYSLMRDSTQHSHQPDSLPQPMIRYQRSLFATGGIEPKFPLTTRSKSLLRNITCESLYVLLNIFEHALSLLHQIYKPCLGP
jgi:hypothetical protein